MKKTVHAIRIISLGLCVMVTLLAFGVAKETFALNILSDEVWWGGNSHEFLVVEFPGWDNFGAIDWDTAKSLVTTLGNYHLATITSAAEQSWIKQTLMNGLYYEYWIGAFQDPIAQAADGYKADADWKWVTGEPWGYTDWHQGEPSDFHGAGSEQHAAIWDWSWMTDGTAFSWQWNDEWDYAYFDIRGFIAESDAAVPEPTTLLLLGSGLIGLAGYGRKKFFKK